MPTDPRMTDERLAELEIDVNDRFGAHRGTARELLAEVRKLRAELSRSRAAAGEGLAAARAVNALLVSRLESLEGDVAINAEDVVDMAARVSYRGDLRQFVVHAFPAAPNPGGAPKTEEKEGGP